MFQRLIQLSQQQSFFLFGARGDRFSPSSKRCYICGYRLETLALSVREWTCPSCCCMHDRDVNAAKNIRMIGLADSLGLSDCVKSSSVATLVSASATARGVDVISA